MSNEDGNIGIKLNEKVLVWRGDIGASGDCNINCDQFALDRYLTPVARYTQANLFQDSCMLGD